MPSLAEQSLMLDALSGECDDEMPHAMAEYREEARRNPERWRWCIREAARRAKRQEGEV